MGKKHTYNQKITRYIYGGVCPQCAALPYRCKHKVNVTGGKDFQEVKTFRKALKKGEW